MYEHTSAESSWAVREVIRGNCANASEQLPDQSGRFHGNIGHAAIKRNDSPVLQSKPFDVADKAVAVETDGHQLTVDDLRVLVRVFPDRAGQKIPSPRLGRARKCRRADGCGDGLFGINADFKEIEIDSRKVYNRGF